MDKSQQVIDPLPPEVQECIDSYGRYYAEQHKLGMSVRDDMKYVASVAIRSVAVPELQRSEGATPRTDAAAAPLTREEIESIRSFYAGSLFSTINEDIPRLCDMALRSLDAARSASAAPVAYIEHHKGGDNLTWEPVDHPYAKATPLYKAPRTESAPPSQTVPPGMYYFTFFCEDFDAVQAVRVKADAPRKFSCGVTGIQRSALAEGVAPK